MAKVDLKGNLRMDWRSEFLGDIVDVRDGTHDSPKYVADGYPLITSKNLKDGHISFDDVSYISKEDFDQINKRSKVNKGDILYSMIGSIGNYALVDAEPEYAIKNVAVFKIDEDIISNHFLLHLLNSEIIKTQIIKASKGGTQKFVSLGVLRSLKIPLPPLPIQERIAAILDAADALRQKDQALLKKYDDLTQSLFLDMFGDQINNQKNWDKKPFGENFNSIRYGTSTPPEYRDFGIPFIRATNIKGGYVSKKGLAFITQDEANKIAKCKLNEGNLLIVRSGANTGDCCRINREYINSYGGFDLIVEIQEPQSSFYNSLLNTVSGKAVLKPMSRRAGQPHLNAKQISDVELIVPPIKLQEEFARLLDSIEKQKEQVQANIKTSEALFQSLLQRAFKGEL